jgi:DNA-binding MarR family transcriptional regulator
VTEPGQSTKSVIDSKETSLEPSIQACLEDVGISLLSEWDMLAFVYRHDPTLTSTDQIALLSGYESAVVGIALDRLEREQLIERVGHPKGVRIHRMLASTNARHQRCLQRFVALSESRAARLVLKKLLQRDPSDSGGKNNPIGPESEGKRL